MGRGRGGTKQQLAGQFVPSRGSPPARRSASSSTSEVTNAGWVPAVAARASCGGERLTVLLDGRANAELVAAVADTIVTERSAADRDATGRGA